MEVDEESSHQPRQKNVPQTRGTGRREWRALFHGQVQAQAPELKDAIEVTLREKARATIRLMSRDNSGSNEGLDSHMSESDDDSFAVEEY